MNIVIHRSTAVRGRGGPARHDAWPPSLGAILAHTDGPLWKLTAPWTHRTRPPRRGKRAAFSTSFHRAFPHQITHAKHRKAPKIALGNPDRPQDFSPQDSLSDPRLSERAQRSLYSRGSMSAAAPERGRAGRSDPRRPPPRPAAVGSNLNQAVRALNTIAAAGPDASPEVREMGDPAGRRRKSTAPSSAVSSAAGTSAATSCRRCGRRSRG